jgi:hypothetical protein
MSVRWSTSLPFGELLDRDLEIDVLREIAQKDGRTRAPAAGRRSKRNIF